MKKDACDSTFLLRRFQLTIQSRWILGISESRSSLPLCFEHEKKKKKKKRKLKRKLLLIRPAKLTNVAEIFSNFVPTNVTLIARDEISPVESTLKLNYRFSPANSPNRLTLLTRTCDSTLKIILGNSFVETRVRVSIWRRVFPYSGAVHLSLPEVQQRRNTRLPANRWYTSVQNFNPSLEPVRGQVIAPAWEGTTLLEECQ